MNLKSSKYRLSNDDLSGSWLNNQMLILLLLTLGGIIIILVWQFFDKYYLINNTRELFWVRFGTILFNLLNLAVAFLITKKGIIKYHLIAGFYIGTLYCTLLVALTGASQSPYWFALFFIIIGWFILIPYKLSYMAIHSAAFLVIFFSGQYIQTKTRVVGFEMAKILFLYSGALLVGSFAAFVRNRLDSQNLEIRNALKAKNDEYLTANEELQSEIKSHYQTSLELSEQKRFIENIITNAPIVIWSIDLNGVFTYSHGKGLEKLGIHPNANLGRSIFDIYQSTEVVPFIESVLRGEVTSAVINLKGIYYETRISPLMDANANKTGYMGVSMDITERVLMEKELAKFKLVLDQAPGAVFMVDKNSCFEYLNPEFTRISGYTSYDLLNKNINETLYKGQIPESRKGIIDKISKGEKWQGELLTYNKNGSTYWANTIAAPYKTESGEVDGFIVIQQDISLRKEMELQLQEKEKLYRTLIEKSLDGVAISQDGKILLVNQAFCDIFGYTMDELMPMLPDDLIAPEDRKKVVDQHYKRLKDSIPAQTYTARFIHKTGKIMLLEINAATVIMNGKNASFVTTRDITEKSKIEEALRKSEDKYRKLFQAEMDAIFLIEMESGKIIEANPAASVIYGYTHEELLNIKNTELSAEPDKTRQAMHENLSKVPLRYHRKKDGSIFPVELSAGFTDFDDKKVQIVTSRDISERFNMQKAIEESEKKYKTLVENSQDGIIIVRNNKLLFINNAFCEMLGYDCEDYYNYPATHFIHPEDRHKMLQTGDFRKKGETAIVNLHIRLLGKNGNVFECDTFSNVIDYNGEQASFLTIHNVTENLKMQNALRENEEKYRMLVENLQDGICIVQDEKFKFVNQSLCNMLGYAADEIYVLPGESFLTPQSIEKVLKSQNDKLNEKSTRAYNLELVSKDKNIVEVEAQSSTFIYEGRKAAFFALHNITHRKKIQAALRESEEKYRSLIENADDGIIITQMGNFKFVNRAFCEMMQYSEAELIDRPYLDVVVPEDHQLMIDYHQRRMNGEDFQVIYRSRIIRKDGKILIVELNARTSLYDGKPSAFIITRNITDRLKTEEELMKAKAELEALNNELEKRVMESSQKLVEANTQLISMQKANLQSQFEVLRQQVNPHFLFNSLNVLTSLIKLEPDLAEKFTEHLSKVYRYVLENKDNDLVELKTELEFLDAYIFLLNIRFMDKIYVSIEAEEEKKKFKILPLALQLLIENAIKHNSMSRKAPLKIRIFIDEENILNVVNNLQTRESHMASTGVGLKNIEHRYKLLDMPAPEFYKTETHFVAKIPLKR